MDASSLKEFRDLATNASNYNKHTEPAADPS